MGWRRRFEKERDRRYGEVALEREKALKIKEEADRTALSLAREIQTYKDEKANDLRSQIERERGSYVVKPEIVALADKIDALLKPINEYISRSAGKSQGLQVTAGNLFALIVAAAALYSIFQFVPHR